MKVWQVDSSERLEVLWPKPHTFKKTWNHPNVELQRKWQEAKKFNIM